MISLQTIKERITVYTVGKYGYIAVLLFLLLALMASKFSGALSDLLFVLCEEGLLGCAICSLLSRKRFSIRGSIQMSMIFMLLSVFWLYTLYKSFRHHTSVNLITAGVGIAALVGSMIIWLIVLFRERTGQVSTMLRDGIRKNWHVFLVSLVFLVLYIDSFNYLFKSDSEIYYSTIVNNTGLWDFTLRDLSVFQIGYHATYGYSLFVFPGYYLLRLDGTGIRIINYLLTVATLFCINGILASLYPKMGKGIRSFLLLLFVCNPLITGLSQEINMDMVMTCFLVWFIWAFIRKYTVFVPFFAMLLCFTKENAIVLLFGFMAGAFLYRIISEWKRKGFSLKLIPELLKLHEWLVVYAAILFAVCFVLYNNWHSGSTPAVEDGVKLLAVNTIGINKPYILIKLKQMFLLNFQWLAVIPLILLAAALIFRAKRLVIREETIGLLGAFGCYLLFQLFYITYPHYRYLVPNAFFLTILTAYTLYDLKWKKLQPVIPAALSVAFLIQSYMNIDPVTRKISRFVSTGNGEIISEAYFASDPRAAGCILYESEGGDLSNEKFRDYVQNNRQYLGFERCFEKFLKEIDYDDDTGIMISPIFDDGYWGRDVWTTVNMFGTFEREGLHWSKQRNQLSYDKNDTAIHWINTDQESMEAGFRENRKVWYVELPYREDWDYQGYLDQFRVAESKSITEGQWAFKAYRLLLTESAGERFDLICSLSQEHLTEAGSITAFVGASERKAWSKEDADVADRITYHHIARTGEIKTLCADLPEMILVQNRKAGDENNYFKQIHSILNELSEKYLYAEIERIKTENGAIGVWIRKGRT